MKILNIIALTLVIAGAVNWGLIGLFQFDLVAAIAGTTFGNLNTINQVIYVLVGLAGLYSLVLYPYVTREEARDHRSGHARPV
jgi:uncharacterized protein